MTPDQGDHSEAPAVQPLLRVAIEFNPDNGHLTYRVDHASWLQLLAVLELTKHYAFLDMEHQAAPKEN